VALPDSKSVQSQKSQEQLAGHVGRSANGEKEEYETMLLHDQEYLCSIPIVDTPLRNETFEAEARAQEQKELVRATDRGSELLQGLEGSCLFFISGWWSYSFCYNLEVMQFHQLPLVQGKSQSIPQRDPAAAYYILGRAKSGKEGKEDAYGNEIEVHKGSKSKPTHTEIQAKGGTRYLVQKMDRGTTCDLTGKPRRIEIQYHCSAQANERIAWIKEVTTCSYLMVVYTPRLCSDVAFQPPKEGKTNTIACRRIVPDDEIAYWIEEKTKEAQVFMNAPKIANPSITIGGILVGGQKLVGQEGNKIPFPTNKAQSVKPGPSVNIIAQSKGKADNGKVETLSSEALKKLDLNPEEIAQLQEQLKKRAGDKGWSLQIVEVVGEDVRQIRGIIDGDNDDEEEGGEASNKSEEGSEETYHDEL
jgi:protein OS-9